MTHVMSPYQRKKNVGRRGVLASKVVEHQQLGTCVAQYGKRHAASPAGVLAASIGVLILCASAVFIPVLAAFLPTWQVAFVPLIGFGWMATGCWLLFSLPPFRGKTVTIYEQGMVCRKRKHGEEVILWHEIVALWYRDSATTGTFVYEIERIDGYSFRFERTFPYAEKMVCVLEREIMHRLFAYCLNQYQHGLVVTFGAIRIHQQGISVEPFEHILPWAELKYIDSYSNVISILLKQQFAPIASIPVSSVPNMCVLESLIRHIHRMHREASLRQQLLIPKRPSSSFYRSSAVWEIPLPRKEVTYSSTTSS